MTVAPDANLLATLDVLQKSRREALEAARRAEAAVEKSDKALAAALAQFEIAAATSVQLADIATVATSGAYADLLGKPAIPTKPADIGAATAEEGALARSAMQASGLAAVGLSGRYADLLGKPALGESGVQSVNGQGPNSDGAVSLTSADLGAASSDDLDAVANGDRPLYSPVVGVKITLPESDISASSSVSYRWAIRDAANNVLMGDHLEHGLIIAKAAVWVPMTLQDVNMNGGETSYALAVQDEDRNVIFGIHRELGMLARSLRVYEEFTVDNVEISSGESKYDVAFRDEAKNVVWGIDAASKRPLSPAAPAWGLARSPAVPEAIAGPAPLARMVQHSMDALPIKTVLGGRNAFRQDHAKALAVVLPDERVIKLNANNAECDVSYWYDGERAVIYSDTFPATAFLGRDAAIVGGTAGHNEIVFSPGGFAEMLFISAKWLILNGAGYTTRARSSSQVREKSFWGLGQSNSERWLKQGGVGGYSVFVRDGSWVAAPIVESVYFIDGATGGTSLTDDWFNIVGSVKLGAYTSALAALDAALGAPNNQPLPAYIRWDQGEADDNRLQNGSTTFATYKATILAFFDDVQAELVARGATVDIPIIITLLGSQDGSSEWLIGATMVRRAYIEAAAERSYLHIGSEKYDIPTRVWGEVHREETGYFTIGKRDARVVANVYHGQENNLGPERGAIELDADDPTMVHLSVTGEGDLFMPVIPSMFGFIPDNGADLRTQGFTRVEGRTNADGSFTFKASESLAGKRLIYPTGYGEDPFNGITFRHNQIVRDGDGLPLRSFLSDPIA